MEKDKKYYWLKRKIKQHKKNKKKDKLFINPILERHKWVEPKFLEDDDDYEEF